MGRYNVSCFDIFMMYWFCCRYFLYKFFEISEDVIDEVFKVLKIIEEF